MLPLAAAITNVIPFKPNLVLPYCKISEDETIAVWVELKLVIYMCCLWIVPWHLNVINNSICGTFNNQLHTHTHTHTHTLTLRGMRWKWTHRSGISGLGSIPACTAQGLKLEKATACLKLAPLAPATSFFLPLCCGELERKSCFMYICISISPKAREPRRGLKRLDPAYSRFFLSHRVLVW